jgi:DNA-directed RNA polymerase specialized sigma24 family protein
MPLVNFTEEQNNLPETSRLLDRAERQLPPRMKQAFVLKQQGYKISEITGRMKTTEQTTKNQLQMAVKKMGRVLECK